MSQRPRIPTFGVPEKIGFQDALFVVLAGIGLTLLFVGLFATVVKKFDGGDGLHQLAVLFLLGLGPATAYFLSRWLRASRIPLPIGCGGLVVWVVLLSFVGLPFGWVGVALLAVQTGIVMVFVRRARGG
jgi:hypothetical protein